MRVEKIRGIATICKRTISEPLGCALYHRNFIQI